jgi:hypothetical protein
LLPAEILLDFASKLPPPRRIAEAQGFDGDSAPLAFAYTAIEFSKKPKSFQLRAIFEAWSKERIVREMY